MQCQAQQSLAYLWLVLNDLVSKGSIAYSSTVVIQAGSSSSCVSSFRELGSSSVASNSASNTVSSKSPNTASVS
ncbi:hypothetical protein L204_100480 [Cryptococcus depauperatus]